MAHRCLQYKPLKPGNHPFSFGPLETIKDGEFEIFEDRGEVFVFCRKGEELRCAKYLSHGFVILEDCQDLYEKYSKACPRGEK